MCTLGLVSFLGGADWDLQVGGSEQAVWGETPWGSACCPALPALFGRLPWPHYCPIGSCHPAAGWGQHGWGRSAKWFISSNCPLCPSLIWCLMHDFVCLFAYMYICVCIGTCVSRFGQSRTGGRAPVSGWVGGVEEPRMWSRSPPPAAQEPGPPPHGDWKPGSSSA